MGALIKSIGRCRHDQPKPPLRPFRQILAGYRDDYLASVLALALNLPVLGLILLNGLRGVGLTLVGAAYFAMVLLGYYALIPFVAIAAAFCLSLFVRRLALGASGLLLGFFTYFIAVDAIVYGIYKFHLDAFWLAHIVTDYDTMGVPATVIVLALLMLAASLALQYLLLQAARRIRRPERVALAFVTAALGSFVLSQAMHIVAYERGSGRITALTPRLPIYYPITWHKQATKYGDLFAWAMGPDGAPKSPDLQGLHYPLRPLSCSDTTWTKRPNLVILLLESWRFDAMNAGVTPHIDSLAARSSNFLRHFSSGNSTPPGVFGLIYGIHPTYWDAIKAQGPPPGGPPLLDLLRSRGYALGIYALNLERHKIAKTVFPGMTVHDTFAGSTPDEQDADMNRQLEDFIHGAAQRRQPFMAFAFYKSTHYSYYYPPSSARFQPHRELNVALAGDRGKLESYLNDYRNAVGYVDELVGDVVHRLTAEGLIDHTIIVVTGDHGEEFNDDGAGFWGHASNFTKYQTRVPLVMYVPGEPARRISAVTTHVDVPTTLIQQVAARDQDEREYSNGMNLLRALPAERPLVSCSYVNYSYILGDDVYSVFPMYVQRYRLDNARAWAGHPRPADVRAAMEEITRFRGDPAEREPAPRREARVAAIRPPRPATP